MSKKEIHEEEHRKSFRARIAPIVKSLCSYIVPRAQLFPTEQLQNVPHNPPFDSPVARITGALRRYAEQIAIPEELLTGAVADSAKSGLERHVIQELVEKEIAEHDRLNEFSDEPSPWRIATHTLVLERLGYENEEAEAPTRFTFDPLNFQEQSHLKEGVGRN